MHKYLQICFRRRLRRRWSWCGVLVILLGRHRLHRLRPEGISPALPALATRVAAASSSASRAAIIAALPAATITTRATAFAASAASAAAITTALPAATITASVATSGAALAALAAAAAAALAAATTAAAAAATDAAWSCCRCGILLTGDGQRQMRRHDSDAGRVRGCSLCTWAV